MKRSLTFDEIFARDDIEVDGTAGGFAVGSNIRVGRRTMKITKVDKESRRVTMED